MVATDVITQIDAVSQTFTDFFFSLEKGVLGGVPL